MEDEEIMSITLQDALEREGYRVWIAEDGVSGWKRFQELLPPVVVADLKMPGMDGISLLEKIKNLAPETMVIMMTAYGTIPSAVKAMKLGAYDYITKPFLLEDMIQLVKNAHEVYELREESRKLENKLKPKDSLVGLVGKSDKMQEVYRLILVVAKKDSTVLIYGETGTGKELAAEAIHTLSPRKNKPLVKLSCAALPETLLESELFGHEKGAFTGAISQKIGRFEMADKGSLFLDDVDDMRPEAQVKLLRVLQEKKFERLGGRQTISVDVRVIAASKKNLLDLVRENKFREDLYYRLHVVTIHMPPLRERKEDIPLLVNHFLRKLNSDKEFSPQALQYLLWYDWPGNVRELEHVVERAVVLSDRKVILPKDLPPHIKEREERKEIPTMKEIIREAEKNHILRVLASTGGKKKEAAKILGITPKTLWQKLKEYGIQ